MVDIPMSPPPTKDRSILAVTESGRISLDAPKLRALLLALLTAFGGWQAHSLAAGTTAALAPSAITRAEWDEHVAWAKNQQMERDRRFSKQEADLQRIEGKLDQLLLKMAKTNTSDQQTAGTVGDTLATIATIR